MSSFIMAGFIIISTLLAYAGISTTLWALAKGQVVWTEESLECRTDPIRDALMERCRLGLLRSKLRQSSTPCPISWSPDDWKEECDYHKAQLTITVPS